MYLFSMRPQPAMQACTAMYMQLIAILEQRQNVTLSAQGDVSVQACGITFKMAEGCTEALQSNPCHAFPTCSTAAQRKIPHAAAS